MNGIDIVLIIAAASLLSSVIGNVLQAVALAHQLRSTSTRGPKHRASRSALKTKQSR